MRLLFVDTTTSPAPATCCSEKSSHYKHDKSATNETTKQATTFDTTISSKSSVTPYTNGFKTRKIP